MGYTHYWYLNVNAEEGDRFHQAIVDMATIVTANSQREILAGWDGEGNPEIDSDKISFNGKEPDDYETFDFHRFELGKDFNFCKTAQKPYDVVVTACLAVAAEVIGDGIEVSSDGNGEDWEEGARLASKVLGREVPVPRQVAV